MTLLDLWTALALMAVVEGLLYALFPSAMRQALLQISAIGAEALRPVGLLVASLGVAALWLLRG
jgi:uncharacterized protein YjeT (DUF2065 family)